MSDLSSLSLKDLTLLQTKILGSEYASETLSYSYPRSVLTYVVIGDIGVDYVTGSEGQVKTIANYTKVDSTYTLRETITLKYANATLPTKVTQIDVI